MATRHVNLTPSAWRIYRAIADEAGVSYESAANAVVVYAILNPPPNKYWATNNPRLGAKLVLCDPILAHYRHAAHVPCSWVSRSVEGNAQGVRDVLWNYAASLAEVQRRYRPQPLRRKKGRVPVTAYGWQIGGAGIAISATKAAALEAFCLQQNITMGPLIESLFLSAHGPPTEAALQRHMQRPRAERRLYPQVSPHLRALVNAIGYGFKVPTKAVISWVMHEGNNDRMIPWTRCTAAERREGLRYMVEHPAWNVEPLAAKEILWRL